MEWLEVLLPRQTLEEVLGEEIAKQYRLRWGEDCVYMPVSDGRNYLCVCGGVIPEGGICANCGRTSWIPSRQEMDELQQEAARRLEQEAAQRLAEELRRQEAQRLLRKQKRNRVLKICAAVVGALVVLAAAVLGVFRWGIPAYHYDQALEALAHGEYQLAHREFLRAGEYKDAENYANRFYIPVLTSQMEGERIRSYTQYVYDEAGRRVRYEMEQYYQDPQGVVESDDRWVYERQYDEAGRLTEEQDWYGRYVYIYNQRGDLCQAEAYNGEGEQQFRYNFIYRYDEKGRVRELEIRCKSFEQASGSFIQTERYSYDEQDRVIRQETTMDYPAKLSAGYVSTTCWVYDSQGREVEKTQEKKGAGTDFGDMTQREYWVYDAQDRIHIHGIIAQYAQDPGSNTDWKETYTYNSRGLLTELLTESRRPNDDYWNYTVRITQEYDMAGRRIRAYQQVAYEDPARQKTLGSSRTEETTYDLLGRVVKTVRTRNYTQPENDHVETETVEYGPKGLQKTVCTVTEQNGKVTEDRKVYNENGLLSSVVYESGDGNTQQEHTYAYFYYPEGEQMPSAEMTDPIAEWMPVQLYGLLQE